MNTKPTISIIVPVYNAERYLDQCINSILNQTFKDFELILVDDGSKDCSGNICDSYAAKDRRIKVIHKVNSGQSDSRNIAIGMAESDILGFVDSDDWLEPEMFETLYELMVKNNADISICEYYDSYINKERESCRRDGKTHIYNREEALNLIIDDDVIKSFLWNKLFKRKVISDPMPVSYVYEDHATLFKWFAHADKVVRTTTPLYHYRQRIGSTMHDKDPKKNYHFFLAEYERYNYLIQHHLLTERKREFEAKIVRTAVDEIKGIVRKKGDKKESMTYIEQIRKLFIPFLPVTIKEIGLKKYIRLHVLMNSFSLFTFMMRVGAKTANNNRLKNKKYYE